MDRRSLLATVAGASAVALSGCAGVLDGGGDSSDGDFGIESTTRWAIAPEGSDTETVGYSLRSVEPSSLLEASDEIGVADVTERMASQSLVQEHLGVTDVERFVEIQPVGHPALDTYSVFEGSFTGETIVEALRDTFGADLEQVASRRGYDVYETGSSFTVHAVADGTVVETVGLRNDDLDPAAIEAVVDASTGASDRVTDVYDPARATAERVRRGHFAGVSIEDPTVPTNIDRGQFGGMVASGNDGRIDGDTMTLRVVLTFEDREARETAPIDRWLEDWRGEEQIDDLSTSIEGRFVTVTITVPTSTFFG